MTKQALQMLMTKHLKQHELLLDTNPAEAEKHFNIFIKCQEELEKLVDKLPK